MMGGMSMDKPMDKPVMDDKSTMNKAAGTVVDVAVADPSLTTLVAAIKAAGLVDTLNGSGPFTIFAPSNEAFAKLPAGALEDLLKPENKEKLVSILTYHVVPGNIMAKDVMSMANPSMPTTVNGKQLTVKTTAPVMINNAGLVKADIAASNGVIHIIDTVLMPEM
ncbi:MAG: fasciclin domain-containing protein [Armatimonadetes bacterium]|nr:fasciclin domain-containing protein [Armatimonadota bacterium]